jgi:hypothetical protein
MESLHVVVDMLVNRGSEVGGSSLSLSDGSGVSVLRRGRQVREGRKGTQEINQHSRARARDERGDVE